MKLRSAAILLPLLSCFQLTRAQSDTIPYYIYADTQVVVHRSFMQYNNSVLPYCISVGNPGQLHYAINSFNGSLIKIWKGGFLNANLMWVHKARGIGVAEPLGEVILTGKQKAFATNASSNRWNDSTATEDDFRFIGYDVDERNAPVFKYSIAGIAFDDKITVSGDTLLSREILFAAPPSSPVYHRVISGKTIERLTPQDFLVDNRLRVHIASGQAPIIQPQGGERILLIVTISPISYQISL